MSYFSLFAPLLVLSIFACSYYIYFDNYCLRIVKDLHLKITYLILLQCFAGMLLWSFFATIYSSIGQVPLEYKFTRSEHQNLMRSRTSDEKDQILEAFCDSRNLLVYTYTRTGSIRYCYSCMHIKPDRAHHCAVCKTCYLKMDHHCSWIGICIGYRNYKQFLLFLFYISLYGFFIAGTTMKLVLYNLDHLDYKSSISISATFVVAFMLSIITLFFLIYHLYLVSKNETTLENIYAPNFHELNMTFDLGIRQNFMDVFGDKWYLWFLPIFSSVGCGHLFMINRITN